MAQSSDDLHFNRRLKFALACCSLLLGLLICRLYYLQVVKGSYFRFKSENNRIRTIRTLPPRGAIFDAEGRVLVRNRPAFNVALMLEDVPDVDRTLALLSEISGREKEELKRQLELRGRGRHFEPKIVMFDISREELAKIKANTYRLPGVIINPVPTRQYPYNDISSQLVGYVREITKDQLNSPWADKYRSGDMVGQSGLEKQWESDLQGNAGFIRVEVDARGNRRDELEIVGNEAGKDVYLTIDYDLQQAARDALGESSGAVAAVNVNTGEVLALVSSPSFDANIFSGQVDAQDWESIAKHPKKPLTNRVISSIYPPGSTFKLILGLAGLVEGKISPETTFNCPGYYVFGRRRYHCHKHSGHGVVNLNKAIRESCNSYYYQLGERLGVDLIHKYSAMFGFGSSSGITLPGEASGVIPSKEWKLKRFGEKWYPGDTMPISIGQGYLTVTPLQMAIAVAALANGNAVYKPRLVKRIVDIKSGNEETFSPEVKQRLDIPKAHLDVVRKAAFEVVNHEKGTGGRAALEGIGVSGKTGTAQVTRLGSEKEGELFKDHAWFVAFAPHDSPEIAISVIVEHSGHGGVAAAPVAAAVLRTYFEKKGVLPKNGTDEESAETLRAVRGEEAVIDSAEVG